MDPGDVTGLEGTGPRQKDGLCGASDCFCPGLDTMVVEAVPVATESENNGKYEHVTGKPVIKVLTNRLQRIDTSCNI